MSSTRIHSHSSLPAAVFHSGASSIQSKSHVLAGVQDAYWSDDESDDRECPLCLEEMDVSDLNFKPCPCGYQICRFCWHHIKENLNGRCPACRREYSDDSVQFKPINKEDHKRLTMQKKQRERERKDLDALGRRHLSNVRVVQRNVVYIVGMGPRFAKEEHIPTLRSHEYFGQYGKISKILIVKRTSNNSNGRTPAMGLYVTYHRREDAARCISAVDGAPSPGGGSEIMRASYGTTKYCMAFLRGASCTDHSCMNLHEWGDESDCFTKEDLTTLKHAMRDMETRSRTGTAGKKADDTDAGLPRSAGWAKSANSILPAALHNNTNVSSAPRPSKRAANSRNQRTILGSEPRLGSRSQQDRKGLTAKPPSQGSSSRPQTPSLPPSVSPIIPATSKSVKGKEVPASVPPSESPVGSPGAVDSDTGSGPHDVTSTSPEIRPQSAQSAQSSTPSAPPGIPPPPGLSAPPGLPPPPPSRALQGSESPYLQPSYQMSSQAQALVDDLRARREALGSSSVISPFPDFDRTLQTLSKGEEGGFSFNLDPKLAGDDIDSQMIFPDLESEATLPFHGGFLDAFPSLRPSAPLSGPFMPPPGLSYPHNPSRSIYDPLATRSSPLEQQQSTSSSYVGSFNPFDAKDLPQRQHSPFDDDPSRKMSRFGFARGRQGSASSPMITPSPITNSDNASHASYYNSPDLASTGQQVQLGFQRRQTLDFSQSQPVSSINSPVIQQIQSQTQSPYLQQSSQFQPFETSVSEAQLRELIQSSRGRANSPRAFPADQNVQWNHISPDVPFNDPAIMSARMSGSSSFESSMPDRAYAMNPSALGSPQIHTGTGTTSFRPPPGLSFPSSLGPGSVASNFSNGNGNGTYQNLDTSQASGSTHVSVSVSPVPSLALSSADFPALTAETRTSSMRSQAQQTTDDSQPRAAELSEGPESISKASIKAEKKAAAAERAAERQKLAQERAAAKTAEKERIAQEKAAERERSRLGREKAAMEKAEKLKEEKETDARLKAEKVKFEKERAEKERAVKEQAALLAAERERMAQAKKAAKLAKQLAVSTGTERTDPPKPSSIATVEPVPMLSKMPKKYKPTTKPIRIPQDEQAVEGSSAVVSAETLEMPYLPEHRASNATDTGSSDSRSVSLEGSSPREPTPLEELLAQIDIQCPYMNVSQHPVFDTTKINPAAKMPLEYGPLVHALSALSVGGGSFANSMPSGSIDNAVSSFQQLLETLTQTISDLLRLLPRTTWDDSSSFDGVLRDMLKGDDFLDDGNEEGNSKEDEVAALTMALERRARWMEVQLSKLEELHRDINMAAVRAVLSFNDNGWDAHGFMPRVGNTLQRFDNLGFVKDGGAMRAMTADELEKKLVVAREAAVFAETEVKEMMEKLQILRPEDEEDEYY